MSGAKDFDISTIDQFKNIVKSIKVTWLGEWEGKVSFLGIKLSTFLFQEFLCNGKVKEKNQMLASVGNFGMD